MRRGCRSGLRQAAVNRIKKQIEISGQDRPPMISKEMRDNWDENEKRLKAHYELAIEMLERLPAADTVKHGKWLEHLNGRWAYAKCSKCETVHVVRSNYCPSCGAKMTEEADE